MSLSANFLKDAKVGTLVEIIVGPKEIQGTIISITEDVIKILTKDGKTKNLSLSGITYYEILDFDTPQDNSSKNENRQNSPNTIKDENSIENQEVSGEEGNDKFSNWKINIKVEELFC